MMDNPPFTVMMSHSSPVRASRSPPRCRLLLCPPAGPLCLLVSPVQYSTIPVNLPIMQVTAVVDKSKKRVEGKIRDKIIDPTLETLDHVGDAIKAGVGKVRIAPSSQPTSPEQMAEDLEMGTIDDAATAYKVPKESKQGDHEANLKTPPKTDAGLV